ncbi:MAG: peptidase T, partial [Parasporobacterium sp.]|nr:peptidase T [Parasporobacterium sp.]
MTEVIRRFLSYVAIDTQSQPGKEENPSTPKQFNLAHKLAEELKEMSAQDVQVTDHCYVYAVIPATTDKEIPAIGFVSHMDTSPDMSGENIKPRIVENYDGGTIVLNKEQNIKMEPEQFPALLCLKGKDLIVTDGTTLLGADDKAGVAEIMTMAAWFMAHPEIPHGKICIGFTPDEEVGNGPNLFDIPLFGAQYAYTVDGGTLGEIEYENFNARNLTVQIKGFGIHPGSAKGKMKNSILIGMEFESMLPAFEHPENTEKYEGFHHVNNIEGNVDHTTMHYIVRDHDKTKLDQKLSLMKNAADFLNAKYGDGTVTLEEGVGYVNMKEYILPHMHLIENAKAALKDLGVEPVCIPIRGGTDGATLSAHGLPCPNLCTGGENFHGRYEYACVQSMETCV